MAGEGAQERLISGLLNIKHVDIDIMEFRACLMRNQPRTPLTEVKAACVNVDDCLEKTQGANDSGSCFPVL